VDPIDGTRNFARGIPYWAVLVAQEEDGVITAGVIHQPASGEVYTARRGRGAQLDGAPIHVSPVATLGAGNCFGEIDPLSHAPQAYSMVAATRLKLLTFSSFGIGRLCDALPGVRERLLQTLAPPSPTRSRSAGASSTVIVR